MGYLKGKYKDGTFKRDKGMFSSHLCMEFEDEQHRIYCFGIVFDVKRAYAGGHGALLLYDESADSRALLYG